MVHNRGNKLWLNSACVSGYRRHNDAAALIRLSKKTSEEEKMKKFKILCLTGLVCFLALSVVPNKAWAPVPKPYCIERMAQPPTVQIDPLIGKVIEAIETSGVSSYSYAKNRTIYFFNYLYFYLQDMK